MQTATLTWTANTSWSPRPLPFDADPVLNVGDRAAPGPTGRRSGFHALGEIVPHPVSGGIGMHTRTRTPPLPGERGA
jgi:hypothetical protein